ncbi:hypothetical protein [Halorientalis litorea]|uniref:hypothetical protein n=1 Tax=Halorientalis litorea TaxID=2931977 RepID=UPI001FF64892|nr:hypothetical protein [Halorientalis litorea]
MSHQTTLSQAGYEENGSGNLGLSAVSAISGQAYIPRCYPSRSDEPLPWEYDAEVVMISVREVLHWQRNEQQSIDSLIREDQVPIITEISLDESLDARTEEELITAIAPLQEGYLVLDGPGLRLDDPLQKKVDYFVQYIKHVGRVRDLLSDRGIQLNMVPLVKTVEFHLLMSTVAGVSLSDFQLLGFYARSYNDRQSLVSHLTLVDKVLDPEQILLIGRVAPSEIKYYPNSVQTVAGISKLKRSYPAVIEDNVVDTAPLEDDLQQGLAARAEQQLTQLSQFGGIPLERLAPKGGKTSHRDYGTSNETDTSQQSVTAQFETPSGKKVQIDIYGHPADPVLWDIHSPIEGTLRDAGGAIESVSYHLVSAADYETIGLALDQWDHRSEFAGRDLEPPESLRTEEGLPDARQLLSVVQSSRPAAGLEALYRTQYELFVKETVPERVLTSQHSSNNQDRAEQSQYTPVDASSLDVPDTKSLRLPLVVISTDTERVRVSGPVSKEELVSQIESLGVSLRGDEGVPEKCYSSDIVSYIRGDRVGLDHELSTESAHDTRD